MLKEMTEHAEINNPASHYVAPLVQDNIHHIITDESRFEAQVLVIERISSVLNKVFGNDGHVCVMEFLPISETAYLCDFLEVLTKIWEKKEKNEIFMLKEFLLRFNASNLFRMLSLSTNNKIGSQTLTRGMTEVLMISRRA